MVDATLPNANFEQKPPKSERNNNKFMAMRNTENSFFDESNPRYEYQKRETWDWTPWMDQTRPYTNWLAISLES